MASGGSSFIATPVALSAGHSSPGRAMKSAGMKKSSATELLDQIRQLEVEGQKLRHSNLINLGVSSFNGLETSSDPGQYTPVSRPVITPTSPATLSALMDISNEQKTISDLRTQLDAQRKETERLQQQLVGDFSSAQRSSGSMHSGLPSSPSKTGFSTLPSTELFSARRAHYDYSGPPSHLEKSLKDSQEQVADLRRRLQEANELSEQQKRQFRSNIEELKSKLQETEINRDAVLDLRQKESSNQEMMLNKFQMSIQQLQEKVRGQEEALQEANRRLESTNREKYLIDTALNQIRLLLVDVERKRGKPYFESDPVSKQVPGMLVHTFERFVQEMNSDSDQKKSRISELENEVKSLKQNISQDKESLIKEQQEKITNMSAEHEKQMLALQERANNSRKQATHLQQQLAMIEGQQEQQLKLRDATIVELESKIRHLKEEHHEDRIKWQEKREVYERSQESYQTETLKLRSDRDDALKETATLQSKLEESQNALVRCKTELDLEKQKTVHVWEKETAMQSRQKELETKLEEKQKDTERLEKMLELIKNECNAQVSEKISTAERMERERHLDQISSLTSQLSSLTEKSNRVSLELDLARSEANNLKQQLRDTADKLDSTRIQFEAVEAEKKHVANMLSDKKADMERVTQERDYYNGLLEQRNQEITNLKGQKEKLTIQLEEKEKNLKVLGDQSSKIVDLVDNNTRSNEILREEKDRLMTMLNERTVALEELKTSRETMSKKMKIREKRIKELEGEKQKYEEEAALRQEEMMIVHQEKESLFSELKESRYEVSLLTEQKDAVKRELEKEIDSQAKEISKLQAKVKAADQEVRLAQRTLRTRDSADHQAVKVADKMQKEVTLKRNEIDSLKTKMRWYEDKLDSLSRERNSLEHDKDRLKTSLNKSLTHSQQLSAELELSQNKVMDLKSQISRLETALEKSTTKNAMCQAELEQYQQDVARLKLRHQLDLQEAIQRSLPNKAQEYESPALFSAAFPGQHHMTSALGSRPASGSSERRFPSKDFSTESLPTRDTDEYKYVGSELKHLVDQMKTLMSERKQKQAEKASHHRRSRLNQNGYNSSESLSDTEYHSDVELERSYLRSRSREKSDSKEYSGYSSLRENRSRSLSPHHAHRRSFSNDTSNLLRSGNDCYSTRNGRSEEIHPSGTRDSYSTEPTDVSKEDTQNSLSLQDSTDPSLGAGHNQEEGTGRGIPLPPPTEANNTEDLCRRLEQKIESLTKMGGSLQKENKEMADLMKVQGKKIKKVKESSKKVKKVTR